MYNNSNTETFTQRFPAELIMIYFHRNNALALRCMKHNLFPRICL